jgi:hypothetical protein
MQLHAKVRYFCQRLPEMKGMGNCSQYSSISGFVKTYSTVLELLLEYLVGRKDKEIFNRLSAQMRKRLKRREEEKR